MNDTALILGAHGYMGTAFAEGCRNGDFRIGDSGNGWGVVSHGHGVPDYKFMRNMVERTEAKAVINCAAFIAQPTVDNNKLQPCQTINANVLLPTVLAQVCDSLQVPLIHLSTGCLFDEENEYDEKDTPLRGFDGYCGFYVGTKILAESQVQQYERHYILRLRLPFDNLSSPRNYLNKMMAYPKIFDHVNSLTHRGDFAKAAIQLWQNKAEYGTYHVACEGQISNRDVISKLKKGLLTEQPEFIPGNCTGCRLSTKKLADAGVKLRSVEEAVDDAIENWKPNV